MRSARMSVQRPPTWSAIPLLGLLASGCAPGTGPGAEIALTAKAGQRVEVDVNRALEPGNHAVLLQGALDAGLVLDVTTKRALMSAELGIDARYFFGDDPDLAGEGQINPRLSVNGQYRTRDTTISGAASLRVQPAEATQFDDSGLVENDTQQITARTSVNIGQQLDSGNTLNAGLNVQLVDFTNTVGGLVPTRILGGALSWQTVLTETSTVTSTFGLRQFWADNQVETRSQTADLSVGLEHRRTPRHTIRLSGGLSGIRTKDGSAPVFDIGLTGGAGLTYQLSRLSTALNLTQSIEPSSVGALQAFTRARFGLGYRATRSAQFLQDLTLSRRTDISGNGSDQFALSYGSRYVWKIAKQVNLSLGYSFRMTDSTSGELGYGHKVFMSIDQATDLLHGR